MAKYISKVRGPCLPTVNEELATSESLLYRRVNFNGTFDQVICDALLEQLASQISLSPGFRFGTTILPGDTITMKRVLDQTCMKYPETYVREMEGRELKMILESVAHNIFTPDPYYQQRGDMVRSGGMGYSCAPRNGFGERISDLRRRDGSLINSSKRYKVAGWATVGSKSTGPAVWDVVADHLRDKKEISVERVETPVLKTITNNPGLA